MKRVLVRLMLLAGLAAVLSVLLLRCVLVVRRIELSGHDGIAESALIEASGMEPMQSMLRLNVEAVKNGIDALGTHAFVRIDRLWPDGIMLVVRPRERFAMARCGEGMAVLDAEGVVIELTDEVPDRDLVYLSGIHPPAASPGGSLPVEKDILERYRRLAGALEACGAAAGVSEMDVSCKNGLRLVLRGGSTVLLEEAGDLPGRIAWIRAVAQDMERRGERGVLCCFGDAWHADISFAEKMTE